jgi:hypothetical protein
MLLVAPNSFDEDDNNTAVVAMAGIDSYSGYFDY